MKSDKFFDFIHSLTTDERRYLSRCFNSMEKRPLKFLLYDRILKEKVFNEDADLRIRGKEFKGASKYNGYRYQLIVWILEKLVLLDKVDLTDYTMIRKAVEMDIVDFAGRLATQKVRNLVKRGAYKLAHSLVEYCADLSRDYGIRIEITGENIPGMDELAEHTSTSRELDRILDRQRAAFKAEPEEKLRVAAWEERRLREIVPLTEMHRFKIAKGLVGIERLKENHVHVFRLQKDLVDRYVFGSTLLSVLRMIKELSLLIHGALVIGDRDSASKYAFKIALLEFHSPLEIKTKTIRSSYLYIAIGEKYADPEFIESGLEILNQNIDLFSKTQQARLFYFAAQAFFSLEKYKLSLEYLERFRRLKRSAHIEFSFEPSLLRMLIQFELDNIDVMDSMIDSAKRAIKNSGHEFPKIVVSVIQKLIRYPEQNRLSYLTCISDKVNNAFNPPQETSLFLDFNSWLKAKIEAVPLSLIIQRREKEKNNIMVQEASS